MPAGHDKSSIWLKVVPFSEPQPVQARVEDDAACLVTVEQQPDRDSRCRPRLFARFVQRTAVTI